VQDAAILIGHYSLLIALLASGWAVAASILGAVTHARGLQRSAENALWANSGLVSVATVCLISGFLTNDFRLDYVYHYSSSSQALAYKIGALWGGQSGSLLLWVLILSVMGTIMVATNRNKNRVLMPYATAVVGITIVFFLYMLNFIESARPFVTSAMRADGVGLNPQLKNYWMMIHPPTLYLGYVGFTVPFAFAIAALISNRTGDIWFRTTRRWTIFSWFVLGTGILLGSYWAYIELGWGGYWAWDPVENASLMPWLVGTAFLHSVMIQEKKGMLKVWNVLLIILTFSLCIFGTFLTRSGIISSVHAFATSDIGPAFGWFLGLIFFASLFLLVMRLPHLKSEARLESMISRESSFLFNNMILVGIAATVLLVKVHWELVLLGMDGICTLIAWRKASAGNLKRNFLWPALLTLWVFLALIAVDINTYGAALRSMGRAMAALDVARFFDRIKVFYPPLTFAFGAFVLATTWIEFYRGTRIRMHNRGEALPVALGQLVWSNKRRYGGYIVHVGMVLMFFGIAGSSAYKTEVVRDLEPGQYLEAAGYLMRYDGHRLEAVDDHIGAVTEISLFRRSDGKPLGHMHAEQRMHPTMQAVELREMFLEARRLGQEGDPAYEASVAGLYDVIPRMEQFYQREVKTPSTEVGIRASLSPLEGSMFGEDFYVIPLWVDPATGRASFRIFVNPMVNFIWFGGLVFVLASIVCILPDAGERKRLETALEMEAAPPRRRLRRRPRRQRVHAGGRDDPLRLRLSPAVGQGLRLRARGGDAAGDRWTRGRRDDRAAGDRSLRRRAWRGHPHRAHGAGLQPRRLARTLRGTRPGRAPDRSVAATVAPPPASGAGRPGRDVAARRGVHGATAETTGGAGMTPGVMLVLLLFVVATAALILAPLLRSDATEAERVARKVSEEMDVQSRHQQALAALKELEDDRATDKITDDDYARMKGQLTVRAVELMKQLDEFEARRAEAQRASRPIPHPSAKNAGPAS
jgi:cytochrome c-type biogenesis protein CcmF